MPESIIDFYKNYEPKEISYLGDGVRLADLEGIKEENSELSPGAYLIKYGLLTFATTIGGNAICMDLNHINNGEPRIVYADHTWFNFNRDERKVKFSFYHKDIPRDNIWFTTELNSYLPEIAKTFNQFMDRLSTDPNWDLEDYYNLIGNSV